MTEGLSMAVVADSVSEAEALVRLALSNMGLPSEALIWSGDLEPGVFEVVVDADIMRSVLPPPRPDVIRDIYAACGVGFGS